MPSSKFLDQNAPNLNAELSEVNLTSKKQHNGRPWKAWAQLQRMAPGAEEVYLWQPSFVITLNKSKKKFCHKNRFEKTHKDLFFSNKPFATKRGGWGF